MSHQTICGADELPVELWRQGEAVGRPPSAQAMWTTLGGTVQQLRRHLLSQPIRHFAAHHHRTIHSTLAYHRSGAPSATNRAGRTAEQQHAQDRQGDHSWFPHVWESQCFCFISKASHSEVQTGYTKIVHFFTKWVKHAVLLVKAMQHNLFNLLDICAILLPFYTFDCVQGWTYLPHLNFTVNHSGCVQAKGLDTRVKTTRNSYLSRVQLMAQSQYSTFLRLFLYLWGLLYYAPCS